MMNAVNNNNVAVNANEISGFAPMTRFIERANNSDFETKKQMLGFLDQVHDMSLSNIIELSINDNTLLGLAADAELCMREALQMC